MNVESFTVGVVHENCYLVRQEGASTAILIDPGDEADRILSAVDELELKVEAILITHCHFDHVGAVSPVATKTGAPVYVSEVEKPVLADIMSYVRWPGIGPFEGYQADHTLKGGEQLELAGLKIDVYSTPGHSPGHLTYSLPGEKAAFCGDLLFKGSVGRVDLPGGDWQTLLGSIRMLTENLDDETTIYPGHMGVTTLGEERKSNPFLAELAQG